MDVSAPRRLPPRPGRHALVLVAVILASLFGVAASAHAACDPGAVTWTGGAGDSLWGSPGNWSTGVVPGGSAPAPNVCLPAGAPGYPVQLKAWSTPANPESFVIHGATVNDIDIAPGAGLVVHGEIFGDRGDGYQQVTLTVNGAGTVEAGGSLELLAADDSSYAGGTGGAAQLAGSGTITNDGSFSSVSTTTQATPGSQTYHNVIAANLVDAPGSTGSVTGGFLDLNYGGTVTNQSTWTVAAGATETVYTGNPQVAPGTFNNQGTYVNSGATTVGVGGSPTATFSQAGPESGNPVVLASGSTFKDASGTGSFLFNNANGTLSGTIPTGQTVTVQAAYNGTDDKTDITLAGTQVVNQGTLVFDDPNITTSQATGVQLDGSALVNQGTITATGEAPQLDTQVNTALTNAHGATVNVPTGELNFQGGQTVTNDGTMTVGPGAELLVNSNPFLNGPETFVNAADGTLTPQIASPTSFGTINAGGNLKFQVGGTLAPALVGGYTPALGTSFAVLPIHDAGVATGTFAALAPGFSANYSAESSSSGPNQISVVWGGLPATPGTGSGTGSGGGPTTSKGPTLRASLKVSGVTVSLRLTCPKGASCPRAQVAETVKEIVRGRRVVGLAGAHTKLRKGEKARTVTVDHTSASVKPGHSTTVKVSLDAAGRALLRRFHALPVKVTVRSGKAHRSLGATLHPAAKKHRR